MSRYVDKEEKLEVLPVKGTSRWRVLLDGRPIGMIATTTESDGVAAGWTWSSYAPMSSTALANSWIGFHGEKDAAADHVVSFYKHQKGLYRPSWASFTSVREYTIPRDRDRKL